MNPKFHPDICVKCKNETGVYICWDNERQKWIRVIDDIPDSMIPKQVKLEIMDRLTKAEGNG